MADNKDSISEPVHKVLQDFFAGRISSPKAATELASAALAADASPEAQLGRLWKVILRIACDSPEYQDKLVDILVDLSELPDATRPGENGQREPLVIDDRQVWKDLPMLGWEIRDCWNLSVPVNSTPQERQGAIAKMVNVNRFVALLVATDEPVFETHSWFALVTFREALETPWAQMRPESPLEAWIPAASAWIEVLGAEIYHWDDEFETGSRSSPGKGGPLWNGKHGFCEERWKLWRKRFGEVASNENESMSVRRAAEEAELMMKDIEAGHVE